MAQARNLPALTSSASAALNRAKRILVNVGRWEAAMGVAAVLVIACWIGFADRRSPSASVSGLQGSNALNQQLPFARALGRKPGERRTSRTMPQSVLDRNIIRVQYYSDDVTVRYFTPQPPLQRVPDRNTRIRHISEDVTVRYFLPTLQ